MHHVSVATAPPDDRTQSSAYASAEWVLLQGGNAVRGKVGYESFNN